MHSAINVRRLLRKFLDCNVHIVALESPFFENYPVHRLILVAVRREELIRFGYSSELDVVFRVGN